MKLKKFFIPSGEAGAQLEIVAAKPAHDGPYPTIIFNHGSTGRGHNKSLFSRTISPAAVGNYFVDRGWMTLFPQRRGRGKSGGTYGEGLAPDGSGYSCNVDIAIAGLSGPLRIWMPWCAISAGGPMSIRAGLRSQESRAAASWRSPMQACAQTRFKARSISMADGSAEGAPIMKLSIRASLNAAHLPEFPHYGCTETTTSIIG